MNSCGCQRKTVDESFVKYQEIQLNSGCAADQIKTINLKFNLKLVVLQNDLKSKSFPYLVLVET